MGHATIAAYLRPESPVFAETPQSVGNAYSYRGPTATISANVPVMYELWADGRAVRSVEFTPSIDNSGYSDLQVSTVVNLDAGTETISSALESTRTQIRWMPHELPLLSHPEFSPGGGGLYDLSETHTENTYERSFLTDVMGWEDEANLKLRDANQWSPIVNGQVVSGTVYQATDAAVLYISLRKQGFTSYTDFAPVWTKVSTYTGTVAPGVGSCGQKDTTPSGAPSGYEWIKSGDNAERNGNQAKWQRTEEWTGFKKVWFDSDSVFFY